MILLSVFNQVVHYWLAETLCCCELTQHKVILFRVLPFPLQICKLTVNQSPAAVSLAVFPLSFSLPKGDCFNGSQVFFFSGFFFSIPNNCRPPKLCSRSPPYTAEFLPEKLMARYPSLPAFLLPPPALLCKLYSSIAFLYHFWHIH